MTSLKGKRIVITRSEAAGDNWKKYLIKTGASVYSFPTIETIVKPLTPKLRRTIVDLDSFGWIIFTSASGVASFRDITKRLPASIRPKVIPRIAAVGESTAKIINTLGFKVAFTPSKPNGARLGKELKPLKSPILLLRGDTASPDLPRLLRKRGAKLVDLAIYRTKLIKRRDKHFETLIAGGKIDYLTFASSSAVSGFKARVKGNVLKKARRITAVAISANIAKTLKLAGFKDIRIASGPSIEAIKDAILRE